MLPPLSPGGLCLGGVHKCRGLCGSRVSWLSARALISVWAWADGPTVYDINITMIQNYQMILSA